jgi:hypothetical protein
MEAGHSGDSARHRTVSGEAPASLRGGGAVVVANTVESSSISATADPTVPI